MTRFTAYLTVFFCGASLASAPSALAADGTVLINQDTATSSFGLGCRSTGFPIVICQPGSYRLSGNLTVTDVNTSAISIKADNVTLDLNGFSIIGPMVCTGFPNTSCRPSGTVCTSPGVCQIGAATGIGVSAEDRRSITVVNGSVRGMGNAGVGLTGASYGSYVEKIHADSNGAVGIAVSYGVVTGSTAISNGAIGFLVGFLAGNPPGSSVVNGNYAMGNGLIGFQINCPSTVVGNTASTHGSTGIFLSGASCAAANNASQ